jgi:hypothetical protein
MTEAGAIVRLMDANPGQSGADMNAGNACGPVVSPEADGNAAPPSPRRRGRAVPRSLDAVVAGLGRLIRTIEADIENAKDTRRVNALVYAYSTLAAALEKREIAEVEERIQQIEKMVLSSSTRARA